MLVRFKCPACRQTHILDMPETTIFMTCSTSGKTLRLRLPIGGDLKAEIVGEEQNASAATEEE